jgi:phytoene dehydrogenase-like protein
LTEIKFAFHYLLIKSPESSQCEILIGMQKKDVDAVVIGSGPNGLAAAIRLQQQGLSVLIIEGKDTIGGGLRSAELTLPGFTHDICSAIHPMAAASPFFNTLPLHQHGLEWVQPPIAAAHPFDDGTSAVLTASIKETASLLGEDENAYLKLIQPIVKDWGFLVDELLAPFHFPKHPLAMGAFGLKALPSALHLSKRFVSREAKGLWAGWQHIPYNLYRTLLHLLSRWC